MTEKPSQKQDQSPPQSKAKNRCPVCHSVVLTTYLTPYGKDKKVRWFHCLCGCVFHIEPKIEPISYYTKSYKEAVIKLKGIKDRYAYFDRLYIPIIEEITYGRRFLDVGFGLEHRIENLKKRGWLAEGIDIIDSDYIKGDFEFYDFKEKVYDFIFMGHILETFTDPVKMLKKAWSLLKPTGVLMITTPDTEIIHQTGTKDWGYWERNENYVLFSERQLKKSVMQVGFDIVLCHKNYESRFAHWHDTHMILQKPFIREDIKDDSPSSN